MAKKSNSMLRRARRIDTSPSGYRKRDLTIKPPDYTNIPKDLGNIKTIPLSKSSMNNDVQTRIRDKR